MKSKPNPRGSDGVVSGAARPATARLIAIWLAMICLALSVNPAAGQSGLHGTISNDDGTWETGVQWGPEGRVGPEFGAFAERMPVAGDITAIEVTLRRSEPGPAVPFILTAEIYVWADAEGMPGALVALLTQDVIEVLPEFPGTLTLSFPLAAAGLSTPWVGARLAPADWSLPIALAADGDRSAYIPGFTNVAPDLGLPEGWQPIELVFPGARTAGLAAVMENITAAGGTAESVGGSEEAPAEATGCWDFERFAEGEFDAPGCAIAWPDTFGSIPDFEGWSSDEGTAHGFGLGPFVAADGTVVAGAESDVEGQVLWFYDPVTGGFPAGHFSAFILPELDDGALGMAPAFSSLVFYSDTEEGTPPEVTQLQWVVGSQVRREDGTWGPWKDLACPVDLGPQSYMVPLLAQGAVRQVRIGMLNASGVALQTKGAGADKAKVKKATWGPQEGYKPVPVINQGKRGADVTCQSAAAAQCLSYWAANGYPEILPGTADDALKDRQKDLAKELAKEIEPTKDGGADGKKGRGWGGIGEFLKTKGLLSPQVPGGPPPPRRALKSHDIRADKGAPYDSIKAHLNRSHDVILDFKAYKNTPQGPEEVKNREGKPIAHAVTGAQVVEENGKKIIRVADPNGSSTPTVESLEKAGKAYKDCEVTETGPPLRFKCKAMEYDGVDFYELTSIHIVRPEPSNAPSRPLQVTAVALAGKSGGDSLVTHGYAVLNDGAFPLGYFAMELEVPYEQVEAPPGWTWEPLPSIPPGYETCENAFGPAGIAWRTTDAPIPPGGQLSGFAFKAHVRYPIGEESVDWYLATTDNGGEYGFVSGPGPLPDPSSADPVAVAVSFPLRVSAVPNPARASVDLRWNAPRAGGGRLTIFDALGRVVWQRDLAPVEPGSGAIRWDARDQRGRRVPSGVYWARAEVAGVRGECRIVLQE